MIPTMRRRFGWAGVAVAVSLTAATVMPTAAFADDEPTPVIDRTGAVDTSAFVGDVSDVSNSAQAALDTRIPDSAPAVDGLASTDNVVTDLPTKVDPRLSAMDVASGRTMSVSIPGAQLESTAGATARFDSGTTSDVVAQATDDGSIQVVNVASTAAAAKQFSISTDVPEGTSWQTADGGSLNLVDSSGTVLAVADAPWALDATGKSLPTSFTVEGTTITQHTDTTGATFPVVSDPDVWWVIGTSAMCAAEIASLAIGAAKVVAAFAKAEKIINATKSVISAYERLGGTVEKVVNLLKKYIKNKSSLSKVQIEALSTFVNKVGEAVFNLIGLGNCYALATTKW